MGADSELSHSECEARAEFQVAKMLRKSSRIQNAKVLRLRRSSRLRNRILKSNMFDGLRPSLLRSDLKAIRDMKNKAHLNPRTAFSQAQKKGTLVPHRNLSDDKEENEDKGQDSYWGQSTDAKISRASSLYKAARANVLRKSSFKISVSGPNTTVCRGYRARPSPWKQRAVSHEDSDDSDDCPGTRCRPLYQDRLRSGAELADIDPMAIDRTVGFESIGGLSCHITALKEMVLFPLLYGELFDDFKIPLPRGCLFHGPPGTGKTMVARALANECSRGSRKVTFFMRKGADCLTKWVGESERQLRLLFKEAYQMRPSIIFFDEIDGLAPIRSGRQDQIHSSIVSTLLSLMDGVDSRREVVVIGATNRLDAIDPALRRPGRFDREFLFGLPDQESRKEILKIYMQQWPSPPSDDFLEGLAQMCVGYSGAELRGLCTEAVFSALRRQYPQIYETSQKLQLDPASLTVMTGDFLNTMKRISPALKNGNTTAAMPLTNTVAPLLSTKVQEVLERVQRLFPHALKGAKRKRETEFTSDFHDVAVMDYSPGCSISARAEICNSPYFGRSRAPMFNHPRLLLVGCPGSGLNLHVAPALLHALERFPMHSLELHGSNRVMPEEACAQAFLEAKRSSPSVLYLPYLPQWWETAWDGLRHSFRSLLSQIPSSSPVFLLATSDKPYDQLDPEIQSLFCEEYREVFSLTAPSEAERSNFFKDLILRQAAEAPPPATVPQPLEILPLAPSPPPPQLSEQERHQLEEQEEDLLRELRLFLRNVTERLTFDRRFKVFTKPVNTKKITDYRKVVGQPMDLSTLLDNIDKHRYITVSEFVSDADLIWQNALKYNPESGTIERNIRHRAFALKDTLHAIIREDLDKDFERACQEVKQRRMNKALTLDSDPEKNLRQSKRQKKMPGKQQKKHLHTVIADRTIGNISEPLQVDHRQLQELLQNIVVKTEGMEVEPLEKLHALLSHCIGCHRNNANKTDLIKEMQTEVERLFGSD